MAFVDYYKILGVDKNIPQKDVRAAYRKRGKRRRSSKPSTRRMM